VPLSALNATCYELTFDLSSALGGGSSSFPDAVLQTPFGAFALPLALAPAPAPSPLTVISVDADAGGNVSAALAAAAAVPGSKLVQLGPRPYQLSSQLLVPNNTVLAGTGSEGAALHFSLQGNEAGSVKAIVGAGSHWGLRDFGISILQAPAATPAIWMQPGSVNFSASGLSISLLQSNVSNALFLEGSGWEVADCTLLQAGICRWPPESANTDFSSSVTFQLHGASDGVFRRNSLSWQCSAFDMDVSSRIIFEDNVLACSSAGVIPHGNSVSFYDWRHTPVSQGMSYSHNTQSRPANNSKTDWAFHESWTTDGPGGWGGGLLQAMDGATIIIASGLSADLQAAGATALVLSGPGTGQYRQVLARPNATAVVLSAPLDDHVVLGQSLVAIVATVGGKVVGGNKFTWGSVVQEFGTTMGGIFADNSFDHQNNAFADSGAVDGSLTGFGLCYGSECLPQC
jgi:hypothetical protein